MPLLVTFAFRATVASNAQRVVLYPDAKATRPFGVPITPAPTLARTVPPRNGPIRLPRRQVPLRSAVRPGLPRRLLLPVQPQGQPLLEAVYKSLVLLADYTSLMPSARS